MKTSTIAITGGAASGKSEICRILASKGYSIVSADAVVAEMWRDPIVLARLQKALDLDDVPTKDVVREAILRSVATRKVVNQIFHRAVLQELLKSESDFAEVPLLFESCIHPFFGEVWVASCGEVLQKLRLKDRGLTDTQIAHLLSAQLNDRTKIALGDRVIRTNGTIESVENAVRAWHAFATLHRHHSHP